MATPFIHQDCRSYAGMCFRRSAPNREGTAFTSSHKSSLVFRGFALLAATACSAVRAQSRSGCTAVAVHSVAATERAETTVVRQRLAESSVSSLRFVSIVGRELRLVDTHYIAHARSYARADGISSDLRSMWASVYAKYHRAERDPILLIPIGTTPGNTLMTISDTRCVTM